MILQVTCPSCQNSLRIPAGWLHQPVQCKHCGCVVQLEKTKKGARKAVAVGKAAPASSDPPPAAVRLPAGTPPQSRLVRRRMPIKLLVLLGLAGLALLSGALFIAFAPPAKDEEIGPKQWAGGGGSKRILALEKRDLNKPPPPPLDPIPPHVLATIAAASRTRPDGTTAPPPPSLEPADGFANRRLLGISVNHYLYHNGLSYGPGPYSFRNLLEELGRSLKFGQITELSDASTSEPAPPMKTLVEKAITDLCATSRPQDRIVLLFAGHILEVEGIPCLVPFDGAGSDRATLIPLDWVYGELARSKARQKVLILDLCRLDPTRGYTRPGSGALGKKTAELLSRPPAGVQVWAACAAGQQSYEDTQLGSVFLSTLQYALPYLPAAQAKDTLPIAELARFVNEQTTSFTTSLYDDTQTPLLAGREIVEGAAPFNASEKPAPKVTIAYAVPDLELAGIASRAQVEEMLAVLRRVPPVRKLPEGVKHFDIATFPLFRAQSLVGYEPTAADTPLRATVLKAIDVLARHEDNFRSDFVGEVDDLKRQMFDIQRNLATAKLVFEEMEEEMKQAIDDLKKEKSKRWQALFGYVYARLLERRAYVYEYNYQLGRFRTENRPELKPEHRGWRLAARAELTARGDEGREAKQLVLEAKGILLKIVEDHKGTPFAVAAARDAQSHSGLEWQPTR
ncbi:MAG: caspase domain-containing protein [Gemmataceae bacterium]